MQQAIQILKVFDEVTKEVSSEKTVSLSKMKILSRLMARQLRAFKDKNKDCPQEINELVNNLHKGLSERFGVISKNELVTQATLLDPRFKKQGFADDTTYRECYTNVVAKMKELIAQEQTQLTPQVTTVKGGNSSIWEEFDETINQLQGSHDPGSAAIVELDKYLSEAYLPRSSDPLNWWESRKLLYPRLYQLVLKRLCIPATSVPCERIFSKAGQICTEKRNRLTSSRIAQILFINHNIE